MKPLILALKSVAPVSPELESRIADAVEHVEFPANHTILKIGQVCRHVTFIESGLVRIFHHQKDNEVTTWLLQENDIFNSPLSFFRQQPSYEAIVALEPCRCWRITYQQLHDICREDPSFLCHYVSISNEYYLRKQQKEMDMLLQSTVERYSHLIEKTPELLRRVPAMYLYSYLGMSKAAFIRARKDYNKSNAHSKKVSNET